MLNTNKFSAKGVVKEIYNNNKNKNTVLVILDIEDQNETITMTFTDKLNSENYYNKTKFYTILEIGDKVAINGKIVLEPIPNHSNMYAYVYKIENITWA